ncbi:hypothetical protein LJB92_03865 [Bacteroidales bacterium OttesenSCG-928-M06]|nr:hypothetical protein [Bacteroidales bacterium OttesenSCG-928-M06]
MKTIKIFTLFFLIGGVIVSANEPVKKVVKEGETSSEKAVASVAQLNSTVSLSREQQTLLTETIKNYHERRADAYAQADADSTAVDFSLLVEIYKEYETRVDSILTDSQKTTLEAKAKQEREVNLEKYKKAVANKQLSK